MNQQRDIERLLDQWLGIGPDKAPDRVVDIVTDRIERQSQRPVWRHNWRPTPVNAYMKIAVAAAAVLIVAFVGYNLLPAGSTGTGGPTPTASPTPTATPTGAFGGIVRYSQDGVLGTTDIDAVANGASVSGTAITSSRSGTHTVRLACATRDRDVWAFGGTTEQSTISGEPVGTWSAVFVKEGSPQRIAIWLSDNPSAASDCDAWLALIQPAEIGAENFVPVEFGALVLPSDLAP
jgi:hypothetical protein